MAAQNMEIVVVKQKIENLESAILTLKQEKTGLEDSIKDTREKVLMEIEKIVPAAADAVNGLTEELKRGLKETSSDILQLQQDALETGKGIGRLQGIILANEYLSDVFSLINGEENIPARRIRVISSGVVRGMSVWFKRCNAQYSPQTSLISAVKLLLEELEKWKV